MSNELGQHVKCYSSIDVDLKYISKQFTSPKFLQKWNLFGAPNNSLLLPHSIWNQLVSLGVMASQITSLIIVYSTVYWGTDQRKHQSVTGLCPGISPVTGEFPAQMSSNAENVSIWRRHHIYWHFATLCTNAFVAGEILYRLSNMHTDFFSMTVFDYTVKIVCFLYSHVLQYWIIGTQAVTWSTTIQHKAWFAFIILDVYFIDICFVPGF